MSLELILPHLRPVAHLITDDSISEVMLNGAESVWIEKDGELQEILGLEPLNPKHITYACSTIAHRLGIDFGEDAPILDAKLEDGSRVAAMWTGVSQGGITLTIRKFRRQRFTLESLAAIGSLSEAAKQILDSAVHNRETILVSGAPGAGKTSLVNALIDRIPGNERIGIIEDTTELQASTRNKFQWETRRAQCGQEAVTMRDLVKAALRHRPDRIIIGEVRGAEAFDLLQALNVGHAGSISTIHANSAHATLSRLAKLTLQANLDMPFVAIQSDIGDLIKLVAHVQRRGAHRFVSEIIRIHGFDLETSQYLTEDVYTSYFPS